MAPRRRDRVAAMVRALKDEGFAYDQAKAEIARAVAAAADQGRWTVQETASVLAMYFRRLDTIYREVRANGD